jgi:hypothetical protein
MVIQTLAQHAEACTASKENTLMQWLPRTTLSLFVACLLWYGSFSVAHANLITNGDFSTGDLTGWTLFTTSNGTLGEAFGLPDVIPFDTNGDTVATSSARFQVGQVSNTTSVPAGGGLSQLFASGAGFVAITVDTAVVNNLDNFQSGIFRLLLDGIELDSHTFGQLGTGAIGRYTLTGLAPVLDGTHELRIEMTRRYKNGTSLHHTPFQFVDNVVVNTAPAPMPEPGTWLLLSTGVVGLLGYGWRYRRATL